MRLGGGGGGGCKKPNIENSGGRCLHGSSLSLLKKGVAFSRPLLSLQGTSLLLGSISSALTPRESVSQARRANRKSSSSSEPRRAWLNSFFDRWPIAAVSLARWSRNRWPSLCPQFSTQTLFSPPTSSPHLLSPRREVLEREEGLLRVDGGLDLVGDPHGCERRKRRLFFFFFQNRHKVEVRSQGSFSL